jgi:hypothetical protein
LLRVWHIERQPLPHYRVGDVSIPVRIFVGGDGRTRYGHDDVICHGPISRYELPDDVAHEANRPGGWIERKVREAADQGRVLVNNRQIRLNGAQWGSATASGGLTEKPLRLELGWTDYFHTLVTNMATDQMLPGDQTVGEKYQGPLDSFRDSRLSNPVAVNLSIATSDEWIYITRRSQQVAWNMGGLQPAVSGDGQPEDLNCSGVYDPFLTAQREASEEATGLYVPGLDEIEFFGLARTFKTRFPFLFGQINLKLTHRQLESQQPTKAWEGRLIDMGSPFTLEAVTNRVRELFLDQRNGRIGPAVGTTLFSLLQSVLYRWPERWSEVVARLELD